MKSVFNTPTLQPPRRIPSPIIYEGDEKEDEDDYFFSPNEGDLDENGDIEDASPSSRGSELYYTPSISPASVRSADRSPAFMQTPVKHDRSNATQTPSSVSKSSHRTPKQQHQQRIPMIRTPGKVVSNAQRQMSDDAKSVHDAKIHSKWMSMLNNWGFTVMFRSGTLRRRLRRGIPPDLRPVAWHRLCDITAMKYRIPNPNEIDTSHVPKLVREDIEKDLDRTYPEHDLFSQNSIGQIELRKLLLWYAAIDPETHYCQGMSFVAGLLLTYFTTEEAFYSFKHCLSTMGLRCMYLPGLVDLQRRQYVLTQLGWHHMDELWQHLMDNGVQPMMYATEWFMTLFTRGFDFQLSTRVVEIFMFEGFKILYRVALTILNSMKSELLLGGFEEILRTIRIRSKTIDPQAIMVDSFSWKFTTSEIVKYENAYNDIMNEQKTATTL
jgi:hypothetical protein